MPVELTAFTEDRRIHGAIPLADDRLSDMLNSVPRIVVRGAAVRDLDGGPDYTDDVTLLVSSVVLCLSGGRRGMESRRRRTDLLRCRIGFDRFVVTGSLHVPKGLSINPASRDPGAVLSGRDLLVPLTEASVVYDIDGEPTVETGEMVLLNRSLATWIDIDDGSSEDFEVVEKPKVYHAAMVKDFTGAS